MEDIEMLKKKLLIGSAFIILPVFLLGATPETDREFFNTKDLAGWSAADMSYWSVKDGAIVGHSDEPIKGNKFIWSEVPVGDFHLSVDVKLTPAKRNAGIQFRSVAINESGQAKGYQGDAGGGLWGKIYHEHGRRKLDWNDRGVEAVKHGDWNRYEILAVGDRIWTAINGTLRAAIKDPEGERAGKIAFQIHAGPPQTVLYRNPTLKHNPKVELAGMNEAELNAELKAPDDAAPIPGSQTDLEDLSDTCAYVPPDGRDRQVFLNPGKRHGWFKRGTYSLLPDEKDPLKQEWLFQVENNPKEADLGAEIKLTEALGERSLKVDNIQKRQAAYIQDRLTALSQAKEKVARLSGPIPAELKSVYFEIRKIKREIMLAHPAIDFNEILFVDIPYPTRYWIHEAAHRSGRNGVMGGKLQILTGFNPDGDVRTLAPSGERGAFWRPDLSFDGKRILFCMKPEKEKTFNLYEIGVDGNGLRQVTSAPGYSDLDPIYLPDGGYMFLTDRANSFVRCWPNDPTCVLARCDKDGKNIYITSAGNEPDFTPALLPDGRILYTRWEYTDKEVMRMQSLWTVNPDGTGTKAFYGNQSFWPDILVEARPLPDSSRVIFTSLGHHNFWAGPLGIIDPGKGLNYPDGITRINWELPWCEVGRGPEDKIEKEEYHNILGYAGYKTPFPLTEDLHLVSIRGGDYRADPDKDFFSLYLADTYGNRELIYRGEKNILYAQPVRPRTKPPVIPSTVKWPGLEKPGTKAAPGVFYSNDVYEGVPDIPRGTAKYIRVIQQDSTTYSMGVKGQGKGAAGVQPHMAQGPPTSLAVDDSIKRVLGLAPIEADGSYAFEAPPGVALHFQLLDENYRCIQTMRSFTNVMPGERRGCVGCHEQRNDAPPPKRAIALQKAPAKLIPVPWGTDSLGYKRDIQPILDKHCGKCHQNGGKGQKAYDLTVRPSKDAGIFDEPYVTLVLGKKRVFSGPFPRKEGTEGGIAVSLIPQLAPPRPGDHETLKPMSTMSYTSKLIDIASSGKHHKVKVDPLSLRKLIVWVDFFCPYNGEPEIRAIPDANPKQFLEDGWAWPPRTKTYVKVNRPFAQDAYGSQEDRLEPVNPSTQK